MSLSFHFIYEINVQIIMNYWNHNHVYLFIYFSPALLLKVARSCSELLKVATGPSMYISYQAYLDGHVWGRLGRLISLVQVSPYM